MPTEPRLLSVIGARPEIIQAAPLAAALADSVDEVIVHTGQHYDAPMSGSQITDTRLPEPHHNLGVGSGADLDQLELSERRLGELMDAERFDAVLVRGDTNATLAGARAASARGIPLLHVEAGLRSYRQDMPEERNRVETDRLSQVLFAPTESARANLEDEGIEGEIHVTGDVLCDMLLACRGRLPAVDEPAPFGLATVHRNYNTDDPERLSRVLECLGTAPLKVVLPVHPRTRARIDEHSLAVPSNVELRDPVAYTTMLALERQARFVATDSGGVQREAYIWGVPCLTLREETEWVETVQTGWNTLVGADPGLFAEAVQRPRPAEHPPVFGDGHAAQRIAEIIASTVPRTTTGVSHG